MKNILITTIAAVVLVGCGEPSDFHKAAGAGNIEAVKQHLAAGADVNAKDEGGKTPLDRASEAAPLNRAMTTEAAALLRKHGAKTGEELKAK